MCVVPIQELKKGKAGVGLYNSDSMVVLLRCTEVLEEATMKEGEELVIWFLFVFAG